MALDLDVARLKAVLADNRARWTADVTALSHIGEERKRLRLGAVPPPGRPTLEMRESTARARVAAVRQVAAAAAAAPPGAPPAFDWRQAIGSNYMTPVQEQGNCGSCVAFGTIAATEATLRVQVRNPGLPVDLSEAQLFYCHARAQGRMCSGPNMGWWPDAALTCLKSPGVADEACYPYTAGDQNCSNLCGDWTTRARTITNWHAVTDPGAAKQWLAARGPLVACLTVYDDFFSYVSGVYHHVTGERAGGHCVCVAGYDDVNRYWICKNSWRSTWGESGYFRIGYGECGVDSEMWAVDGVSPTAGAA